MIKRGISIVLGVVLISTSLIAMENIEKKALECLCSPAEEIQEQLNKLLEAIDEFQLTSDDEELNKQLADLKTEALLIQQSQQLGSFDSAPTRTLIRPQSLKTAKLIVDTIQLASALMQTMLPSKTSTLVDQEQCDKDSMSKALDLIDEIEAQLEQCIHPKDASSLNDNIKELASKLHNLGNHKIAIPSALQEFLESLKNDGRVLEKAESAKFILDTIRFLVHTKKVAGEIMESLDTNSEARERCKPIVGVYKSYCKPYATAVLCLAIAVVLTTVFNT